MEGCGWLVMYRSRPRLRVRNCKQTMFRLLDDRQQISGCTRAGKEVVLRRPFKLQENANGNS